MLDGLLTHRIPDFEQILSQTKQIYSLLERQGGFERKIFCQTRLAEILIGASLSRNDARVCAVACVARNPETSQFAPAACL